VTPSSHTAPRQPCRRTRRPTWGPADNSCHSVPEENPGGGKPARVHPDALPGGLDTPTSGQVFLGDTELGTLRDDQLTDQDWRVACCPPPDPPPGTPHGKAAVCVVVDQVVLVSSDGVRWGLPGGRPEPGETWTDTLRREVLEEACASVTDCRLLGYSRGACIRGPEAGLVLVRAHWQAGVQLNLWQPRFEMTGRRLVPVGEALAAMWIEDGYRPMYRRVFAEAGL
jgi:8-oxo-dGTP pyrophosphatase MutT (NUDIX family)